MIVYIFNWVISFSQSVVYQKNTQNSQPKVQYLST